MSEMPGPSTFEQLGPRVLRRAEPRLSIAVAGGGCVLAILGVLIVSGDAGSRDGDLNRWPGVILCAAVVAAGYVVLSQVQRGPVATGGAVAAALGVPPLMFFLTWDADDLPPYSTEAILAVSALAWLGSYLVGPARGRPFFLGGGLVALWATVLQVTEKLFDGPFAAFGSLAVEVETTFEDDWYGGGPDPFGPSVDLPDPTTIGMLCLLVGVGYLVAARFLDRLGRHGTATPFVAAMVPPLVAAPMALADELDAAGAGLLVIALGAGVALVSSRAGRRATTWLGGGAVALGTAVFLGDMTDDATVGGMLFLAGGIALVFLAHLYATARREPDEMAVVGAPMAGVGAPVPPIPLPAEPSPGTLPPPPPRPSPPPDDVSWAPPEDGTPPPPPF